MKTYLNSFISCAITAAIIYLIAAISIIYAKGDTENLNKPIVKYGFAFVLLMTYGVANFA